MDTQILFHAGQDGYTVNRIPTLIALPHGRVIAFCEGRRDGLSDTGTIHILARISDDGGAHFGEIRLVAQQGEHTVGNPCPVYDGQTGQLHLVYNSNLKEGGEALILKGQAPRSAWHQHSSDGGETWSNPSDITASVSRPDWTWYACGPCHGVQLQGGRLLIPCNHAVLKAGEAASGPYISHAIYSDDHGQHWRAGQDVADNTNECALAELPDGRVYMNMRSYHGQGCRAAAWSSDGGESWQGFRLEPSLPDPVCQGSLLMPGAINPGEAEALLFVNAARATDRRQLRIRKSLDGGQRWSSGLLLHDDPAAYSDLVALPGGMIGCLYEAGEQDAYESIRFTRIPLAKIS